MTKDLIKDFKDFIESEEAKKTPTIYFTNFSDLNLVKRGKVRDIYEVDGNLLIVSTDRISAFDVILPTPIPLKGMVLNMLSYFWFEKLKDTVKNAVITADVDEYPSVCKKYKDQLLFRSILVKKANVYKVECIVRGYLAGSGYEEYQKSKTVCGIPLPDGLKMSSKLPEPIFTPSTKEDIGHDRNITLEEAEKIVGSIIHKIKEKSIDIFKKGSEFLETKGIILADTKFEFGYTNEDELLLIDEVLTPDSSRFWFKELYKEGEPQESYDKQFVRDYLKTLKWNKTYPGPDLPKDIVDKTSERYVKIAKLIMY